MRNLQAMASSCALGLVQLDPNRRSPGHSRLFDRYRLRKEVRNGFCGQLFLRQDTGHLDAACRVSPRSHLLSRSERRSEVHGDHRTRVLPQRTPVAIVCR
jgi:hypothetical protein